MRKIDMYHELKRDVENSEKAYNKALERFEGLITSINRNLINGTPKNNTAIKQFIVPYTEALTKANLVYLLAVKNYRNFLDNGVVKHG